MKKALFILHTSPPVHGASKVGDFIKASDRINCSYSSEYIDIQMTPKLSEIGKWSFKKYFLSVMLLCKVLFKLLKFRPEIVYYTVSSGGAAFYRDLIVCSFIKIYCRCKSSELYYHYHTNGVNAFIKKSKLKRALTKYFISNVNLILLSESLSKVFKIIGGYRSLQYLPNSVQDSLSLDIPELLKNKRNATIKVLYLSNMIKEKGYFTVLMGANSIKERGVEFHFAGAWKSIDDEKEFKSYVVKNQLEKKVFYHGFVSGTKKEELLKKSHIFAFPTRYENEAFPLSILEALSYGLPVISTEQGAIKDIICPKSGILINKDEDFVGALEHCIDGLVNTETAKSCRAIYLNNYTVDKFEQKFIQIMK